MLVWLVVFLKASSVTGIYLDLPALTLAPADTSFYSGVYCLAEMRIQLLSGKTLVQLSYCRHCFTRVHNSRPIAIYSPLFVTVCVCVYVRVCVLAECLQVLLRTVNGCMRMRSSVCSCRCRGSALNGLHAGKMMEMNKTETLMHAFFVFDAVKQRGNIIFYWDCVRKAVGFPWVKLFGGCIWNQ